jgi:hypothetical protein
VSSESPTRLWSYTWAVGEHESGVRTVDVHLLVGIRGPPPTVEQPEEVMELAMNVTADLDWRHHLNQRALFLQDGRHLGAQGDGLPLEDLRVFLSRQRSWAHRMARERVCDWCCEVVGSCCGSCDDGRLMLAAQPITRAPRVLLLTRVAVVGVVNVGATAHARLEQRLSKGIGCIR